KPLFVNVLLLVEIAAQSMACPPLVTRMVPLLVSETAESVFTRKASLETALIKPLLVIVRLATPELLSIGRPVPRVWIVPLFIRLDGPVIDSATPFVLILIAPPALMVPVPAVSV